MVKDANCQAGQVYSMAGPCLYAALMQVPALPDLRTNCLQAGQHSHCQPWVLAWGYRKQNLLKELIAYQADILCLQEVQSNHFLDFLAPKLQEVGYSAIYKKKTTEIYAGNSYAIDGCATFFRRERFALVKKYEVGAAGAPCPPIVRCSSWLTCTARHCVRHLANRLWQNFRWQCWAACIMEQCGFLILIHPCVPQGTELLTNKNASLHTCMLLVHSCWCTCPALNCTGCLVCQVEFNKAALSLSDALSADQRQGALNRLLKVLVERPL